MILALIPSCRSALTYIDGNEGYFYIELPNPSIGIAKILFRSMFLLLYGHLPNEEEASDFESHVTNHYGARTDAQFFRSFVVILISYLVGVVGALVHFI